MTAAATTIASSTTNTTATQCSNCRGVGGLTPLPHLADPPTSGQNSTPGGRVSTLHLSFSEVGMLLDSHFLPMQFLKYLQCDDLNVTTILIHIEDYGLFSPGLSVKFY